MEEEKLITEKRFRPGIVVDPVHRLDKKRVQILHDASMKILDDPGILCFNEEAVSIFEKAGCDAAKSDRDDAWIVRIPESVVTEAVEASPSRVVLGARNPDNKLILDSSEPRVYFGTGSETNMVLETEIMDFACASDPSLTLRHPVYREERGSIRGLCDSARLCDALSNVDFFIRNVNVQDDEITWGNKDVNVFFASLMYMSKHVQAGLANVNSLNNVIDLGIAVTGGATAFAKEPILSFIACLVKSPLQMVDDTTQKVIEIAKRGVPLVISSSPQGGSTAPIQEEGMVAMINAEILAGITLTQLVNPGTPVLYGAVPVRARLDTLHDLYGAPEFIHYNVDCVQMARMYGIPVYSTAGVGDAKVPGLQSTLEKVFSMLSVAQSGAHYIHYAFGLLDRTAVFCPAQAVIDDANLTTVKRILAKPPFDEKEIEAAVSDIRKVMSSSTRLFARHIRKQMRRGVVSDPFSLEGDGEVDEVIQKACAKLERIRATSGNRLSDQMIDEIHQKIPGLLPREYFEL